MQLRKKKFFIEFKNIYIYMISIFMTELLKLLKLIFFFLNKVNKAYDFFLTF